ncbi:hypothetical protein ABEB36_009816 [Hypothenemus hampei]|uniref:DNA (cytosine-5-)-methyltransferase n=1 Tax=Hypothenemus hampei TaxID=57062 RepID=A0ABD1EHN5_HYPHA
MRNILIKTLSDNKFTYQEFLLSPVQFGIPNSRLRYYCIARRLPYQFCFENDGQLRKTLPEVSKICQSEIVQIQDILDDDLDMTSYYLTDSILRKRLKILDICFRNSRKSCCFTKAYGRFIGTGSVFTNRLEEEVTPILQKLYSMDCKSETYILLARSLNLRFFTPKEISKLMCFPKTFSFPNDLTQRQKYMVLGNSVNVRVVTELIKLFQA